MREKSPLSTSILRDAHFFCRIRANLSVFLRAHAGSEQNGRAGRQLRSREDHVVNSDPAPGATISGCGGAVGGCQERLKIVFSLRPDVDLRSQRLHVSFITPTEAVLDCFSTGFDLQAGETFAIQVSCPSSPGGATTPFKAATMTAETGPSGQRIEQDWKVNYTFLP